MSQSMYDTTDMRHITFRDPSEPLSEEQALLRKEVYAQITNQPETFDMGVFEGEVHNCGTSDCGTVRCIAGWAIYLATGLPVYDQRSRLPGTSTADRAVRVLGLTPDEYYGTSGHFERLFYQPESEAVERMRVLAGL